MHMTTSASRLINIAFIRFKIRTHFNNADYSLICEDCHFTKRAENTCRLDHLNKWEVYSRSWSGALNKIFTFLFPQVVLSIGIEIYVKFVL